MANMPQMVSVAQLAQMPGFDAKHPLNIRGAIQVLAAANNPLPVSVRRALPALKAANYAVQDLNKYLMQPGRIYDILPWATTELNGIGKQTYSFFGRTFAQATNGLEDTNMQQAGNIGQNNGFVITSIGVDFLSSIRPTLSNAADATLMGSNRINDFTYVMEKGYFNLTVNNIPLIMNGIGPLKALPSPQYVGMQGSVATGTAFADIGANPVIVGSAFDFNETPITLANACPFAASIAFNAAPTLPSANTAIGQASRIACYMDGYWLRPAG